MLLTETFLAVPMLVFLAGCCPNATNRGENDPAVWRRSPPRVRSGPSQTLIASRAPYTASTQQTPDLYTTCGAIQAIQAAGLV
jgi:hypothetical protein